MKKQILLSALFLLIVGITACSKSTKDSLVGKWKVSKLSMAGSEQDPELFGPFAYELNEDGSYNYAEAAKKEAGKWSVSEDNKTINFEPTGADKYSKELGSVTPDSVVLMFKSFTMDVKHVLVR
jgi:hypothetical protein